MPWRVERSQQCPEGKPWACIKEDDGEIEGCHSSRGAAMEQQRALYQSEAAKSFNMISDRRRRKYKWWWSGPA